MKAEFKHLEEFAQFCCELAKQGVQFEGFCIVTGFGSLNSRGTTRMIWLCMMGMGLAVIWLESSATSFYGER